MIQYSIEVDRDVSTIYNYLKHSVKVPPKIELIMWDQLHPLTYHHIYQNKKKETSSVKPHQRQKPTSSHNT